MILGAGSPWKTALVIGLAALALVLFTVNIVWPMLAPAASPQTAAAPPAARRVPARAGARGAAPAAQSLDPTLRLGLLASVEGVQYKGSGRNIFRSLEEAPIPTPVAPALKTQTGPPLPPPINLKFYGFASRPGESKKVFLSQGEDIFIAAEGDIVNRRYRVVRIGVNSVEVEDVLDGRRQVLPLTSG
ncbi:MAG: hypothetical protein ACRD2K_00785 [Terriglobales bacterium]